VKKKFSGGSILWHLALPNLGTLFYNTHAILSLPAELRYISESTLLKNKLKTYLFKMAFNVQ